MKEFEKCSRVAEGAVFMEFLYLQYHIHIVFICGLPVLLFAVSRRNGRPRNLLATPASQMADQDSLARDRASSKPCVPRANGTAKATMSQGVPAQKPTPGVP